MNFERSFIVVDRSGRGSGGGNGGSCRPRFYRCGSSRRSRLLLLHVYSYCAVAWWSRFRFVTTAGMLRGVLGGIRLRLVAVVGWQVRWRRTADFPLRECGCNYLRRFAVSL